MIKCGKEDCDNRPMFICECNKKLCDEHTLQHRKLGKGHICKEIMLGVGKNEIAYLKAKLVDLIGTYQKAKENYISDFKVTQTILMKLYNEKLKQTNDEICKAVTSLKNLTNSEYILSENTENYKEYFSYNYTLDPSYEPIDEKTNIIESLLSKSCIKVIKNPSNPLDSLASQLQSLKSFNVFPEFHKGKITSLTLSKDQEILATGSVDFSIKLWDTSTFLCISELLFHQDCINSLHISHNNQILLSASGDKTVSLWNLKTNTQQGILQGHADWVHCVVATKNLDIIFSGSKDTTIRVWDLVTKACKGVLIGHKSWVNDLALIQNDRILLSGSGDLTIKAWNISILACQGTITGHTGYLQCIAISSNEQCLASGDTSGMIKLWNIIDNPQVNNFTLMHKKVVFGLSFTSDGGYLASSSGDFTVVIWHLQSRKPVKYWNLGRVFPRNLSFLHDNSLVVGMENGSVKMFSLKNTSQKSKNFKAHIGPVTSMSFPRNEAFVITQSSNSQVKIWKYYEKKYVGSLKNHSLPIVKSYICPLNHYIITQDTSLVIRIFKLPDKMPKHLISSIEISKFISEFPGLNDFL
ncbi:hypothetical protein SteCoe_1156 [Stentor coeruleus]|uniref:Uncharacterized protein n=1 Tax=Stentor coeruleus TaxID=5963 RepID=A0A1R2D2E3_9CILI|nr:hypothetical protein SteCoe_1156 [Stentor coeruleus]